MNIAWCVFSAMWCVGIVIYWLMPIATVSMVTSMAKSKEIQAENWWRWGWVETISVRSVTLVEIYELVFTVIASLKWLLMQSCFFSHFSIKLGPKFSALKIFCINHIILGITGKTTKQNKTKNKKILKIKDKSYFAEIISLINFQSVHLA